MTTTTSATNSTQKTNVIDLYPSNWLYNAGVVGLIRVIYDLNLSINFGNGLLSINLNSVTVDQIFEKWNSLTPSSKNNKKIYYGYKDAYYSNQTENSIKNKINHLIFSSTPTNSSPESRKKNLYSFKCSFCDNLITIKKGEATFLDQAFGNILLGSQKSFSNMYWNLNSTNYVCPKCEFILLCHHLALTSLSDDSEIFINAPSFETMWYLNKFAREILQSQSKEETRGKREILAMTIIEYATKIQTTLGQWTSMNIEIVSKKGSEIQFFSLPYQVVQIISDRKIASLLSDIGEFKVLNIVLNQEYKKLLDLGYKTMRWGLTKNNDLGGKSKASEVIDKTYFLQKNRDNPLLTAQKLLELYVHIEQKLKNK